MRAVEIFLGFWDGVFGSGSAAHLLALLLWILVANGDD